MIKSSSNPLAEQVVEHNVGTAAIVIHPAKAGVHAKDRIVTTAATHLTCHSFVISPVC